MVNSGRFRRGGRCGASSSSPSGLDQLKRVLLLVVAAEGARAAVDGLEGARAQGFGFSLEKAT